MKPAKTIQIEEAPVLEAIETLSSIAELELSTVLHDPSMVQGETSLVVNTVRWLHQKNAEHMQSIIRENLHVLLNYFERSYASDKKRFSKGESLKGVRTIMLLADEAAENLDRYTQLFLGVHQPSVKSTREFRELCDFYTRKIAPHPSAKTPKIGALPITDILTQAGVQVPVWAKQLSLKRLSLELEDIQRDIDYELLFLKKEDGSRFFTPRLVRSMKLACDIEQAVDWQGKAEYPQEIDLLRRYAVADGVRSVLDDGRKAIDIFFHYAHRAAAQQTVLDFYSPCIAALETALQAIHQSETKKSKGVVEYFNDFKTLFGSAMQSTEFKKMLTYPPENEHSWEYATMHLSEVLASSFVLGASLSTDLMRSFTGFVAWGSVAAEEEVGAQDGTLSRWLNTQYAALRHLVGTTANATLGRMLEELKKRQIYTFEPLIDGAIPHHLCDLSWADRVIPIVQMPSPTRQDRIDAAIPTEIFQVALHRIVREEGPVLIVNLQDRSAWRDGARCLAIEGLSGDGASVLSLPRDGEWYQQEGDFEKLSSAKRFKEAMVLQILGEGVHGITVSEDSLRHLIDELHTAIYGGRNSLTKTMRCELIDLVHLFLILRAIEEVKPGSVLVCCKDGLDITGTAIGGLFSWMKFLNQRPFSEEEKTWLGTAVLGLPLIERQRLLFPDRFRRLVNLIKVLEEGAFTDPSFVRAVEKFFPSGISSAALLPFTEHR